MLDDTESVDLSPDYQRLTRNQLQEFFQPRNIQIFNLIFTEI